MEYVQISGIQTGLVLCKLTHSFPGSQLFEVKQESPELCNNVNFKKKNDKCLLTQWTETNRKFCVSIFIIIANILELNFMLNNNSLLEKMNNQMPESESKRLNQIPCIRNWYLQLVIATWFETCKENQLRHFMWYSK